MAEVGVKQLGSGASRVIRAVEGGDRVVVTKRGRPAAVILSVDEAEDYLLAFDPEFARRRAQGRRDFRNGQTVSLDEI
jgi:prevent-host-death family protein